MTGVQTCALPIYQVAASLRNSDPRDDTPRAKALTISWIQPLCHGLVDVEAGGAGTPIYGEGSPSPDNSPDSMEVAGQENILSTEIFAGSRLDDCHWGLSSLTGAESLRRRKGVSKKQPPSRFS